MSRWKPFYGQLNFEGLSGCLVTDGESGALTRFELAKRECGLGFARPWAGVLVLANTLLGGSGMLGIPYAFSRAGWVLGLALVLTFGLFSAFGSHLLQCTARKLGTAPCTFYTAASAVAPRWTWLIDGAVMIKCFGVGTSYLIIVGDLAPDALHFFGAKGVARWHTVASGFLVAGTLACFRSLNALRYTAMGSMVIVSWTVTLVLLFLARLGDEFDPCASTSPSAVAALAATSAAWPLSSDAAVRQLQGTGFSWSGSEAGEALPCFGAAFEPLANSGFLELGKALPVFIFGFTCQQNVFTVCGEVKDASRRRIDGVLVSAYAFAGLVMGATALAGYATYGAAVESNLLKGYPQGSASVQLTRLLYAALAIFSFPLQAHPSRASALALWTVIRGPPRSSAAGQSSAEPTDAGNQRAERLRFVVTTLVGLALALVLALSVSDLGIMLGIVGATGSTMVSYILPGLLFVKAHSERSAKRVLAIFQLGLGCAIMPFCLVVLFL